jgi:predicted nucleic acid-binding protein
VTCLVIADCSIISAFVDIGCLGKLNHLLTLKRCKLIIPDLVLEEIRTKITKSELRARLNFSVEKSKTLEVEGLRAWFLSLGDGEIAVILCALTRASRFGGTVFAGLDDRTARRIAKELNVRVIGTLGLLKLMFDSKAISKKELVAYCKTLQKIGFYFTGDLVAKLVQPQ